MEALRALGLSRTVVVSSLRRSWDPTRPERRGSASPANPIRARVCLECNFSGSVQSPSDLAATQGGPRRPLIQKLPAELGGTSQEVFSASFLRFLNVSPRPRVSQAG